ncbi:proline racemase family protein [Pseudoramibacter alactolyticus]|uniref:proline racemase family protein n=1 Tax=Pseudoramibacter alactolyticus TaxID=113287 RepID=UPI00235536D9|nr:proline racemase family protein [Pseudoramibacter alactolyticus]
MVYEGHLIEKTKIGDYDALVPTITGQSWIYGYGNLVLDPTDPFEEGFTIGDIWA